MSIAIDELDYPALNFFSEPLKLQQQLWNGRVVSPNRTTKFRDKHKQNLYSFGSRPDPAQLVWKEHQVEKQFLFRRDFSAPQNNIIQIGFGKQLCKFWKKHKTEILIGTGVAITVTVIIVVSVGAAGAVAAAGAAALDKLQKGDGQKNPEPTIPSSPQALASPVQSLSLDPIPLSCQQPSPNPFNAFKEIKPMESPIPLQSDKHWFDNQYTNYQVVEPLSLPNKSWIANCFETIGREMIDPDLLDPNKPLPSYQPSQTFITQGIRDKHLRIGFINGMNNTYEEGFSNTDYARRFTNNKSMEFVYNKTHGPIVDALEIVALNLRGRSPNTADELLKNWIQFHKENADLPNAKYLQECHSQGAIHVLNALKQAPKEIRDRIIVLAIAPAVVVPKALCYNSYNYACKKDFIPQAEFVYRVVSSRNQFGMTRKKLIKIVEDHNELILVVAHPEDKDTHSFQAKTYTKRIEYHVDEYITLNGEYP